MTGIFSQPSHDVIEEGMRYRLRLRDGANPATTEILAAEENEVVQAKPEADAAANQL